MTVAVIPARWGSTRLPGKPLVPLAGRPMIEWVCRRVDAATSIDRVVVATDDERIARTCERLSIEVMMTSPGHVSGTDRVAEVVRRIGVERAVNVQGDEPLIDPASIDRVVHAMSQADSGDVDVVTGFYPADPDLELSDPSVVCLTRRLDGTVLSMSRYPIPFGSRVTHRFVHVGLYAFTADALERFNRWEPGPLERAESIELFRFLERGRRILGVELAEGAISVDTPEDAARVDAILREEHEVGVDESFGI